MPLADPGVANGAAHPQQTHQQEVVNLESPSAEIAYRPQALDTQEPAGESGREGAARTAPGAQIEPAADCESRIAGALALEIDRASIKHLDYLVRQVWQMHSSGLVSDNEVQGLAELIRERQRAKPPSFFRT